MALTETHEESEHSEEPGGMEDGPRRRYILGIGLILLVVLCWVGGDELTQLIFHEHKFDKPFFLVYFKSTMFMVYLLKLFKYVPRLFSKCVVPVRNPDEMLGPSSYERLEYDRSDSCSEMTNPSDDELILSSDIRELEHGRTASTSTANETTTKKGLLKKSNCSVAESSVGSTVSNSELPLPGSASPLLDCSTSKRIKFRSVAEVRCLTQHNITLQREARRPYNARSSYSALSKKDHLRVAATYSILWFIGNYLNALALEKTALSYVEVLSATSSVFVLFMSAAFPVGVQDRLSLTKFVVVLVNIAGVVILCTSKTAGPGLTSLGEETASLLGLIFAIGSSVLYAIYVVYFRRVAGSPDGSHDRVDMVLFFGSVGLVSSLLLLPLFPILHYGHIETFSWPDKSDWKFLILTALLGKVISDLLWLWSTLLTSALVATIGLGLTSPVSILVDIMVNKRTFTATFFVGTVLVVVSFAILNLLCVTEYSDPVLDLLKRLYNDFQLKVGSFTRTPSEIQSLLDASLPREPSAATAQVETNN